MVSVMNAPTVHQEHMRSQCTVCGKWQLTCKIVLLPLRCWTFGSLDRRRHTEFAYTYQLSWDRISHLCASAKRCFSPAQLGIASPMQRAALGADSLQVVLLRLMPMVEVIWVCACLLAKMPITGNAQKAQQDMLELSKSVVLRTEVDKKICKV